MQHQFHGWIQVDWKVEFPGCQGRRRAVGNWWKRSVFVVIDMYAVQVILYLISVDEFSKTYYVQLLIYNLHEIHTNHPG